MYKRFYGWNGVGGIVPTVYNVFSNFCPMWGRECYTSVHCWCNDRRCIYFGGEIGCFEFLIL
jgi:hypothetical protein